MNLAHDVEKKKAEPKTPHFLTINQDIVGRFQKAIHWRHSWCQSPAKASGVAARLVPASINAATAITGLTVHLTVYPRTTRNYMVDFIFILLVSRVVFQGEFAEYWTGKNKLSWSRYEIPPFK